ncbi:toll-like receptor 6 [Liolophura sinensis]|uniref:toll-like receptor 6 n=1 Tax=Liolophura sinensis TaxID=3198878 RepID=UPI00315985A5
MGTVNAVLTVLAIFATYCNSLCPVHPKCSCRPANGTDVVCTQFSRTIPRFLDSPVNFRRLRLSNKRTCSIEEGSFLNVSATVLIINYVQITTYGCEDFVGLEAKLVQLFVSRTTLSLIPKCAIANLTRLTRLELTYNQITDIHTEDFESLKDLTYLSLAGNKITNVEPGCFRGLDKLSTLDLRFNNIAQLSEFSFQGLVFLKTINLQNNSIVSLPLRIFDTSTKLESVRLDNNDLEALPGNIFDHTVNLKSFYVTNNRLSSLPPLIFSKTTSLYQLDLIANKLRDIPLNLFNSTPGIRIIYLSDNQLTTFNFDVVSGLKSLQYLHVNRKRNSPQAIDSSKYESFISRLLRNSPSVVSLKLRNNGIKSLPLGAFSELKVLNTLDLSQNNIDEIPEGFLANSPKVKYLMLQHNHIKEIPPDIFTDLDSALYHLDLSGNQLSSTAGKRLVGQLPKLTSLRELFLSDMPLPSLSDNITEQLGLMNILHLRNCSLDKTTEIRKMLSAKETDFSKNSLKTFGTASGPVSITISYMTLNISYNYLPEINILFSPVRYISIELYADNNQIEKVTLSGNGTTFVYFRHLSLAHNSIRRSLKTSRLKECTILDLSHNRFSNVTEFPLMDPSISTPCTTFQVITLNFSHNVITNISPNACLGRVTTLDLSYNQLTALPFLIPVYKSLTITLKSLFLMGNKLYSLSPDILGGPRTSLRTIDIRLNQFREIDNLKEIITSSPLAEVYLAGNPLSCNCSLAWMRAEQVSMKFDKVRCQTPPKASMFLLQCYSMESCFLGKTSFPPSSAETHTFCDEDIALEIYNLTWSTNNEKIEIRWNTQGPGGVRGMKLTYHDTQDSKIDTQILIHPDRRSVVMDELLEGRTYNVCIVVENTPESLSDPSCVVVTGNRRNTDASCAVVTGNRRNTQLMIIALAVSLAVCAVALFALLFCMLITRCGAKVCFQANPEQPTHCPVEKTPYRANYANANSEQFTENDYAYVNDSNMI